MGTDEVYKQIKTIETGDYVVFARTLVGSNGKKKERVTHSSEAQQN